MWSWWLHPRFGVAVLADVVSLRLKRSPWSFSDCLSFWDWGQP